MLKGFCFMRPLLSRLRRHPPNAQRLRERLETAVLTVGTLLAGGVIVGEGLKHWSHHQMAQRMPKTEQERHALRQTLQQDFATLRRAHPSIPNYNIALEEEPSFGASASPGTQTLYVTPPLAQTLTSNERMSILAHEAKHLMANHDPNNPNRHQLEHEADLFACKALNAMNIDGRQTFKTAFEKASQLEGGPIMHPAFWYRENDTHPSPEARYQYLLKNCPPPTTERRKPNP